MWKRYFRKFATKKESELSFLELGLVSWEGLEPSTPGLKGPCSNLLSYQPKRGDKRKVLLFFYRRTLGWKALAYQPKKYGGRYRSRTYDLVYVKDAL